MPSLSIVKNQGFSNQHRIACSDQPGNLEKRSGKVCLNRIKTSRKKKKRRIWALFFILSANARGYGSDSGPRWP